MEVKKEENMTKVVGMTAMVGVWYHISTYKHPINQSSGEASQPAPVDASAYPQQQ